MSLLTKPEDLKGNLLFKGLIYGQPGIGKSTLALSAPRPVCIDAEKGIHRVDPQFRVPSLQVDNYSQILQLLNSNEIDSFDTIVFDTAGAVLDLMQTHLVKLNPKNARGNGALSMQGYGARKVEFANLIRLLFSKQKNVLFVAHDKEDKKGDDIIIRPEIGSAGTCGDIIKAMDFVGYMEAKGKKRTICFAPSDTFYAKNSLGLNDYIEIDDTSKGNKFIEEKIVKLTRNRLDQQAEDRAKYDDLITIIDGNIESINSLDEINSYYSELGKLEVIWDSAYYEKDKLWQRAQDLDFDFDKTKKIFIEKKNA